MDMSRRHFGAGISALLAGCSFEPGEESRVAASTEAQELEAKDSKELQIGMLLYPEFTSQDFVGPQLVFGSLGNVRVHVLWKEVAVVTSDSQLGIQATTALRDCPKQLDVLFVPGGSGTWRMMNDPEILAFLRHRGERARFVTSVCTGSLLLGAAGLLCGYRAATHWAYRDVLPLVGAIPVADRVVRDRNRITGGGVTAGLDFGLTVSAELRGADYAKQQELIFEYAPEPPFGTGRPETAGPQLTAQVRALLEPAVERTRQAARAVERCVPSRR
ncbi:DJ-1/PfpI family protein [Pendulispora rubella]|uniref:DJ-1/PfpI family protein n=1 Tax=Pendulispora rubella TaxID=2741070 RepID=A0ABZ2LAA5_9BACT